MASWLLQVPNRPERGASPLLAEGGTRDGMAIIGAQKATKHTDPTTHNFWNPLRSFPRNQNVGSLCLRVLVGPEISCSRPSGLGTT